MKIIFSSLLVFVSFIIVSTYHSKIRKLINFEFDDYRFYFLYILISAFFFMIVGLTSYSRSRSKISGNKSILYANLTLYAVSISPLLTNEYAAAFIILYSGLPFVGIALIINIFLVMGIRSQAGKTE